MEHRSRRLYALLTLLFLADDSASLQPHLGKSRPLDSVQRGMSEESATLLALPNALAVDELQLTQAFKLGLAWCSLSSAPEEAMEASGLYLCDDVKLLP